MKGLRKVIPRVVNPNPRVCPLPGIEKVHKKITPSEPVIVEAIPEGVLPDFIEEKKSTKTQTTHKPSKWKQ
jgi:hypothetical protein